jgi:hypothetical protein
VFEDVVYLSRAMHWDYNICMGFTLGELNSWCRMASRAIARENEIAEYQMNKARGEYQ